MFRKLADNIPALVAACVSVNIRYANRSCEKLTGFRRGELQTKSFIDLVHPEHREFVLERHFDPNRRQKRARRSEIRLLTNDGKELLVELTTVVYGPDVDEPHVLAFAIDLSELRATRRAARDAEQRCQLLSESTPMLLWTSDPDGNMEFFNKRWLRFRGRQLDEEIGEGWMEGIHPDDLERCKQNCQAALKSQRGFATQFRLRRHDGEYRLMLCKCAPMRTANSGFLGFIGSCIDISDQRQVEEQLQADQNLLRQLLDLQDRERRLLSCEIHDGFIQDVIGAHMFLQSIIGEMKAAAPNLNSQIEALASAIQRALDEGRRLIHDLRPMAIDELGIIDGLEHLMEEARAEGRQSVNLTHRVSSPSKLTPLLEATIYRIVHEAINNAQRHSQADHVNVRLTQVDDNNIVLEISDDGIGFDPNAIPKDRYGVDGIRERARLFGGGATIESSPGQGTLWTVKLPFEIPAEPVPGGPEVKITY